MAHSFQCATNLSSPWMVTIFDLPSSISNIHTLSSDTWFGQFGVILSINIGVTQATKITYSNTTAAYNARIWLDWIKSHNQWSYLINKNNSIKQSQHTATKQLQMKYNNLLNKYEEMKQRETLFENRETQCQSKIKQFINTEKELNETCYTTTILNENLQSKIKTIEKIMKQMKQNVNQTMQEKDNEIIKLKERLKELTMTKQESDETCYVAKILNDNLQLQIYRTETNFNQKLQVKDTNINKLKEIIKELTITKEEMSQTCYAAKMLNDNLQLQMKRIEFGVNQKLQMKDTEINNLKDRLKKLDKKYTNIFKQLVNKIIKMENFNKTYGNQKHLILSTRKHKTRNTQFEYESLKSELSEKYNDICKLNDYIIELEEKLNVNKYCVSYYKSWDIFDVYRWIITIKNKRFNKYKKDLIIGLRKYMIYGIKMGWLTDLDVVNMGISSPTDRHCLLSQIGLIKQKYPKFNVNCKQTEGY
eukprot:346617_1